MNRRSFFSKLGAPLRGVAAIVCSPTLLVASEPDADYILNIGAPQCPHCHIQFFIDYRAIDRSTNEVDIMHDAPPGWPCPLAGKKMRITLARQPMRIVPT